MGRLVASLLILLLPVAGAIEDPAGDVGVTVGGQPIDVPYVDIRNVTAEVVGDRMHLRMEVLGSIAAAPAGLQLNYLFPFQLGGKDGDTVFGTEDGTILCSLRSGEGHVVCRDSSDAYAVVAAGLDDRNVTAIVVLPESTASVAVAGLSQRIEDGNVTAQDFTDNALPYSSRPQTDTESTPSPGEDAPGWPVAALLVVLAFAARQRA